MFRVSNTPSHLCAVALNDGTCTSRLFSKNSMYSTGRGVRQVALVVLQHVGNFREVELEGIQVVHEILEALDVFRHLFVLRIGDKHDAVHAAQHQLPRRVVNHLAGHGVKLELRLEALDGHRLNRQKIEEQRAVGTRRQRHEFALVAGGGLYMVVDLHKVGRLAAHGRAVINDFNLQFLGGLVDEGHKILLLFFAIKFSGQRGQLHGWQRFSRATERGEIDGVHAVNFPRHVANGEIEIIQRDPSAIPWCSGLPGQKFEAKTPQACPR